MDRILQIRLSRQSGIVKPPGNMSILFASLSAIGSHAVNMAVALGYGQLFFIDPDTVGEENIHGSAFGANYVNDHKVLAMKKLLTETYGEPSISKMAGYVGLADNKFKGSWDIAVVSPDTIALRKSIWESPELDVRWWIDARVSGYRVSVFTVDADDKARCAKYGTYLRDPEEHVAVSMKATPILTAGIGAGLIGQSLADIANGVRPLFHQTYDMRARVIIGTE